MKTVTKTENQVLEPEHFASPHLDELSGMTYLSYFMKVTTISMTMMLKMVTISVIMMVTFAISMTMMMLMPNLNPRRRTVQATTRPSTG